MHQLFARSGEVSGAALDDPALSALYRHRLPDDGSAWLRTNFVTTLDGSVQGSDHRSGTINTPSDHQVFALQRAHADAVIAGAETVRTEGYRAVTLEPWQQRLRHAEGLDPLPLLVIISGSLDVDPSVATAEKGQGGPVMIITPEGDDSADTGPLVDAGVEIVRTGTLQVDLQGAVRELTRRGHRRLLCEGGAHLHHGLLAADLVDELCLTTAPVVIGGDGLRTTAGPLLGHALTFDLDFSVYADDGTHFTSYLRRR